MKKSPKPYSLLPAGLIVLSALALTAGDSAPSIPGTKTIPAPRNMYTSLTGDMIREGDPLTVRMTNRGTAIVVDPVTKRNVEEVPVSFLQKADHSDGTDKSGKPVCPENKTVATTDTAPVGSAMGSVASATGGATGGNPTIPSSGMASGTEPFSPSTGLNSGQASSPVYSTNVNANPARTLAQAIPIAQQAQQNELISNAISFAQKQQQEALQDTKTLAPLYKDMPLGELADRLHKASVSLGDQADTLKQPITGIDSGGAAVFRNNVLNAMDKAQAGTDLANQNLAQNGQAKYFTAPFPGLGGPAGADAAEPNPLARSAALADLFTTPTDAAHATTTDALVDRLIMFSGLSPDEQAKVRDRLNLAELAQAKMPDGSHRKLTVLHNGYILGGGKTGIDCSAFVSSILPADLRRNRFTTLDFRTMWIYIQRGSLPKPPTYTSERESIVRKAANAFTAVDIYAGDLLHPGDLLIYRQPQQVTGHVFLVRSYNPRTMVVTVIEAAQSAGGIREREFPLSADTPDTLNRLIRPGLFTLRLKPRDNQQCSYRSDGADASSIKGGN